VVGVQYEENIQGTLQHPIHLVSGFGGHPIHHAQEIPAVTEGIVRIGIGQPLGMPIGIGRQSRHLGDQANDLHETILGVVHVARFRIEGGQSPHGADQHPHGMGVVMEPIDELLDVLVHHGVVDDPQPPVLQLRRRRQFAAQDQVGNLEKAAMFGQLLDGVTPIPEDPFFAVDIGDRASTGRRVGVTRIVGHQPEILVPNPYLPEIDGPDGFLLDGNLVRPPGPVVGDGERLFRHPYSSRNGQINEG
jgi:hypothetical protein